MLTRRGRTDTARLRTFLDSALDKHDGCYEYGSYCALAVLDLPGLTEDELSLQEVEDRRDRALVALLGDLVRFELCALEGHDAPMPQMRPERALAEKRLLRGLAALRPSLERMGWHERADVGFDGDT